MHRLRHALSGSIYETVELDDERILVTKDGVSGIFSRRGTWIEGELRYEVDPELSQWVTSNVMMRKRASSAPKNGGAQ